ncbi:predicted protein [Naegleria gruberi]|uniref:Predicted protein n=1 Tax=Naegleria gruberi TaxID=5762 RepID=D2VLV1_NAEGR|nr:uncharacterized protein NAEGRDRAFT_69909 [Naegleria gruberi]EFC42205.1 predicted protein [Naegleria gruberi]|eukprot:XP_002674949.1 predicted protein [Naegleria gruberi strain NEG-M]
MGNSTSQDGTSTTNTNGENVINFDLFGGSTDDQVVVVTRDFSLDLVDYINYDDQYMEKKYPGFKEQQAHFDALLDSFTRCNLDVETYFHDLKVPAEYSQGFIEICPMNDYTKFRTGKVCLLVVDVVLDYF